MYVIQITKSHNNNKIIFKIVYLKNLNFPMKGINTLRVYVLMMIVQQILDNIDSYIK